MRIKTTYNRYKQSKFVKNALALFTGSVFSQLIVFLTIPFLTRLFNEEAFGIYALFVSSIFLLRIIGTLSFELSINLPKRDKDAINLLAFSVLLVSMISFLMFVTIALFKDQISALWKIEKLSNYIYIIPLSVFLIGTIAILEYWNNRSNLFKNIAIGAIGKSSAMSSIQLLTGVSIWKQFGLIPGLIIGQAVQLFIITRLAFVKLKANFKFVSFRRMFYLAKRYGDIPKFNTVLTFTNTLSNELPVFLISHFFGLGLAGVYGLAIKVSKAPPGIIGQSIGQVFFNRASKAYHDNGNLYTLMRQTYQHLLTIAVFLFIPLFLISYFLDFVFGANWSDVGLYVRILIPWLFVMFLNAPVSSIIAILNKQKTILVYDIALLVFRFLALYLGYVLYDNDVIALGLFSGVGVVFNILILSYFLKVAKNSTTDQTKAYNK